MSDLLCWRCGNPALVIYEKKSLCGPCAVEALDEPHHYLVLPVGEDGVPLVEKEAGADSSTLS